VGYGPSTPAGTNGASIGIALPGGHALPFPTNFGPNNNQSQNINNGLIASHVLTMGQAGGLDKIQQFKAAATWTESDNLSVVAGYQYVGQHTIRSATTISATMTGRPIPVTARRRTIISRSAAPIARPAAMAAIRARPAHRCRRTCSPSRSPRPASSMVGDRPQFPPRFPNTMPIRC